MINKTASELLKELEAGYQVAADKVEQLEAEIKRLREAAKKLWPQEGDKCYVVFASGLIEQRGYHSGWKNELKQGRVFRTKAEAVWARNWYANNAKKMHVLYELEQWAKEFNGDWVADWDNDKQIKLSLAYNGNSKKIRLMIRWTDPVNTLPVFKSVCEEELLAHFGNRLNVLFEVE